ncbi:glycoside hydrolase family 28 protein [Flavobacterium sp. ZS1P14]|uniref:glycoside hydrolase family 28 protein n=1 Tax=Flavobacterium sp. ZS1P14 TaxID=3401729 RepID=UPI003AAD09C9
MRSIFIFSVVLTTMSLFSCGVKNASAAKKEKFTSSTGSPFWINKVGYKATVFKEKSYSVNEFGAIPDGKTLNTGAIQSAIDACSKDGGGIVTFQKGIYLTGSLFVKEGIHFKIDKNVEIRGSQDIKDYKQIDTRIAGIEMKWPAALINVQNQKNVIIDGEGIINGQGKVFWDYYWDLRKQYEPKGLRWIVDYDAQRPRTILIADSKNISLKNLNIQQAGFWTVQVLYSEYITVDGVTIKNNIGGHGPSTDGIDIDSSKWILVQNCDIDCNDDNFCLKAGRDWDGLRVNKPTEYVVIRDCIARKGSGLLTLGSETAGSIRHVYASNITGDGTSNGLNIKSASTRGGTVEDVLMENIKMENIRTFLQISMNWNPSYSYSKLPDGYTEETLPEHWKKMLTKVAPASKGIPHFKNITLKNIDVKKVGKAISVEGMAASTIENITLDNVYIQAGTAGRIAYSSNWALRNVAIETNDGSKVSVENSTNINFR